MDIHLGQLVKSLAGRDKGKHYLVVGFKNDRILLADGRSRTLSRPKKKNARHVQHYRQVIPGIEEAIRQGKLKDTIVRNTLNELLSAQDEDALKSENGTIPTEHLRIFSSRGVKERRYARECPKRRTLSRWRGQL